MKSAPEVVQRDKFLSAITTFGKVFAYSANAAMSITPAIFTPQSHGKTAIRISSGLVLIVVFSFCVEFCISNEKISECRILCYIYRYVTYPSSYNEIIKNYKLTEKCSMHG